MLYFWMFLITLTIHLLILFTRNKSLVKRTFPYGNHQVTTTLLTNGCNKLELHGFAMFSTLLQGCNQLVTKLKTCIELHGFYIRRIGDIHIWVCTPQLRHFIDSHKDAACSGIITRLQLSAIFTCGMLFYYLTTLSQSSCKAVTRLCPPCTECHNYIV